MEYCCLFISFALTYKKNNKDNVNYITSIYRGRQKYLVLNADKS